MHPLLFILELNLHRRDYTTSLNFSVQYLFDKRIGNYIILFVFSIYINFDVHNYCFSSFFSMQERICHSIKLSLSLSHSSFFLWICTCILIRVIEKSFLLLQHAKWMLKLYRRQDWNHFPLESGDNPQQNDKNKLTLSRLMKVKSMPPFYSRSPFILRRHDWHWNSNQHFPR